MENEKPKSNGLADGLPRLEDLKSVDRATMCTLPGVAPKVSDIPQEEFKQAICKCGHDVFSVGSTYLFYPGGKYSQHSVAMAGDPMLMCVRCGQPFMNIIGKNQQPKAPQKKTLGQRVKKLFKRKNQQ